MTRSPQITVTDDELLLAVEDILDRFVMPADFERAARYARRKLELARERYPDADYYTNSYLASLTADTIRENEFSEALNALYEARLERSAR